MNQNPWIEFETIIEQQLEMQVSLSLGRHHNFMLSHGLGKCKMVSDLGTGDGLFLARIAQMHPGIHFHGIDNQANMIAQAGERQIKNVTWILGDALDEQIQTHLGETDGILIRYVVLHISNTRTALQQILSRVRPGTCLWVFDIDPDLCICEPEDETFSTFTRLVRSFCNKHFVEIRTASMLPPILETLGFEIKEVAAEPFDNRTIDPKLIAEYLYREALLYHHFLEGTHESAVLQEIKHFLFDVMAQEKYFVRYGMAMIGAVKK